MMFDNMNGFAETVGVKMTTVVAGVFGAAVSMAVIRGTFWYRLCLFLGGVASAAFMTPLAVHYANLPRAESAVGFIIGMFGMSVTSAIIRTLQDVNFESLFGQIRALVAAWLGRK